MTRYNKLNYLMGSVFMAVSLLGCDTNKSTGNSQEDDQVVEAAIPLNVMTYNIHHANPPSEEDKIDIDAIVKVIEAENPDVVALQEVDYGTGRSGEGNQAALIADQLGMEFYFAKAIDYDGGAYGTAILSKYPIKDPQTLKLPNDPGEKTEDRVVAFGLIQMDEVEFLFGSTHLDYKGESKSRILQVKRLIEFAKEQDVPVIVAGDYNDVPGSETINLMDSEFGRTCGSCAPTIPVDEPKLAIDFIFFKHPEAKFKVKSHKVIDEKYASDHLPVFAEMEVER